MDNKVKRILHNISNTFFLLLLLLSLIILGTRLITGVPSLFGYYTMYVVSGSMEPTIMTDQFILCKTIDGEELEVGDIAAYNSNRYIGNQRIVHRIIEKYEEDGKTYFIFKGDNNEQADKKPVLAEDCVYKIIKY